MFWTKILFRHFCFPRLQLWSVTKLVRQGEWSKSLSIFRIFSFPIFIEFILHFPRLVVFWNFVMTDCYICSILYFCASERSSFISRGRSPQNSIQCMIEALRVWFQSHRMLCLVGNFHAEQDGFISSSFQFILVFNICLNLETFFVSYMPWE